MTPFPKPLNDPDKAAAPPTKEQAFARARRVFGHRHGTVGDDLAPEDLGLETEEAVLRDRVAKRSVLSRVLNAVQQVFRAKTGA
jgi:hypothetical protein